MDSDYRDITITEDDMGEGFKELINEREKLEDRLQRELWKQQEKFNTWHKGGKT